VSQLGSEHLSRLGKAVLEAVLRGYSLTLTIFNLLLLPFFLFYIARDLKEIHIVIGKFIRDDIEVKIKAMSDEILSHVYAFFRGQITVSLIMAILYMAGLWLVGLPYAFIVGLLSGLLNIVPYLGIGIGVVLSVVITLVTEPSLAQFAQVLGVFVAVQLLEGTVLTPKIVGGSVGIHPLLAMVALVVAGQLFGLLGLVIAIPGAAALRVLFQTLRREIDVAP
jgi:predicted PurR-regulated permease PerM